MAAFFGRIYYGWVIVFIGALGIFFSGPGQTYSNSIFIDAYIEDFGWSRSLVSGVYSSATLVAGLIMIFVGRFIDRFGQRVMMVVVGTLFAIACFLNSAVSTIWMLTIGFFAIRLSGQGSMSLIPNTLAAQWFVKKRGFAVSLMALGSFISAMVFPIINTWLIDTWIGALHDNFGEFCCL
ncbi:MULTISPECIES: MFS transporter [Allobacillus]|uniref:MFS transporter n=1 Tax=Allobacillus TaxID=1400133 RepID=UPI00319E7BD9